jgi:hypothetical protein
LTLVDVVADQEIILIEREISLASEKRPEASQPETNDDIVRPLVLRRHHHPATTVVVAQCWLVILSNLVSSGGSENDWGRT